MYWYAMKVVWHSFPRLHSAVHRKAGTSNFSLCKELRSQKLAAIQSLDKNKSTNNNIPLGNAVEQLMMISTAKLFSGGLPTDTEVHQSIVKSVKNITEARDMYNLYMARI